MTPTDWLAAQAWLFKPAVTLPDCSGEWRVDQDQVEARRRAALEAMWQRDDRLVLLGKLGELNTSFEIASVLATTSFRDELDATLLAPSILGGMALFAPPYAAARSTVEGVDWLSDVLSRWSAAGHDDRAAAALHRLPADLALWAALGRLTDGIRTAYWRGLGHFSVADSDDASEAIARLLEHGNTRTALALAAHAAKRLSPTLVLRVLDAVQEASLELAPLEGATMLAHYIDILLGALDDAKLEDTSHPARLELGFLPLLDPHHHRHRFLSGWIEQDPAAFVDLLTWGYRADDAMGDDALEADDDEIWRQRLAHTVFSSWRGFPGDDATGDDRERRAQAWASQVLGLASGARRRVAAGIEVMAVLARMPAAEDGIWPSRAAREILESDGGGDLARHLRIARYNLRGVTTRAVGEGGQQERELGGSYKVDAQELAAAWPGTAEMLRALGGSFEREGKEWDASSAMDMRVLGPARQHAGRAPREDRSRRGGPRGRCTPLRLRGRLGLSVATGARPPRSPPRALRRATGRG